MVKAQFTSRTPDYESQLQYLVQERGRLEQSVEKILLKISKIDKKIDEMQSKNN